MTSLNALKHKIPHYLLLAFLISALFFLGVVLYKSFISGYEAFKTNTTEQSTQKMEDIHFIAGILEEYKAVKGHYPFYDSSPAKDGFVKIGSLITIGSSLAEKALAKIPNPFRLSATKAFSPYLINELEATLKRKIQLPTDPDTQAKFAPNAYYVYFPADDDEYLVLAFLYEPNGYTTELFNPHANVYAIASSEVINRSGFWRSAGIKPRIFKNVNNLTPTNKNPQNKELK